MAEYSISAFLTCRKAKHPKELTIQRMYVIMNIYESSKGVKI